MNQMPEWLRTPLIAALIAAIGYVCKLAFEEFNRWRVRQFERRAKLVALQSLLVASGRVYDIQNELVRQLCSEIQAAHPEIRGPYDEVLAKGHPVMSERQKLDHGVIRSYTVNAMRPLNLAMIDWLATDIFFKGQTGTGTPDDLASSLQTLESHLLLWRAKYEFWIPDKPTHAIVYMVDEHKHGVGFPKGIEKLIERVTGGPIRNTKQAAK